VRVVVDEISILERPRLRFVGVHRQIVRPLFFFRDERPLLPGAESRPAAPAQTGFGDGLDDVVGLEVERFFQ